MTEALFSWLWLGVVGLSAIGIVVAFVVLAWKAWFGPPPVDLQRLARQQGAVYADGPGSGWEIVGPDRAWTLAFRDDGSADPDLATGGETVWAMAAAVPADQAVFVTAQAPGWLRGEAVFSVLKFLARLGGEPLGQLAAQTSTVNTGDASFDAEFAVAATDEALARRCLHASARRLLQAFTARTGRKPHLVWSPGQLTLRFARELDDESTLQAVIDLGRDLGAASACRP